MIIFPVQMYYGRFAAMLAGASPDAALGKFEVKHFPDKEVCAALLNGVNGQDCLMVGTVAPPDSQLVEFLMLADALRRSGARSIQAFLPYLGYSRQDKFASGQSGGIATIGALFRAAGVDNVITLDVHSALDKTLIGLPVASIMPMPELFAGAVLGLGWPDFAVVAPDEGATQRAEALASALDTKRPVVRLTKHRASSVAHTGLSGEVSPRAVVADDILDSGHTLVSACNMLRQHGVREIAVVVTHGLFTGGIWKELFSVGVTSLFVSDSCPQALKTEESRVRIMSIAPLLPLVLEITEREVELGLVSA